MGADLTRDVFLGVQANEQVVKAVNLAGYRVVAFATHGLLPGDLDGLTQPALALSAPAVAKVEGDGLLTMEKILTLRLNADWVVLSACNTFGGHPVPFGRIGEPTVTVTGPGVDSQVSAGRISDAGADRPGRHSRRDAEPRRVRRRSVGVGRSYFFPPPPLPPPP